MQADARGVRSNSVSAILPIKRLRAKGMVTLPDKDASCDYPVIFCQF